MGPAGAAGGGSAWQRLRRRRPRQPARPGQGRGGGGAARGVLLLPEGTGGGGCRRHRPGSGQQPAGPAHLRAGARVPLHPPTSSQPTCPPPWSPRCWDSGSWATPHAPPGPTPPCAPPYAWRCCPCRCPTCPSSPATAPRPTAASNPTSSPRALTSLPPSPQPWPQPAWQLVPAAAAAVAVAVAGGAARRWRGTRVVVVEAAALRAGLCLERPGMSTPQAAGHTALVRQYLRTGFYPTGSRADAAAAPFTPSGMLLKAMVIAGAKSLEGGLAFGQGSPMGPPPDAYQGWGRLSLPDTLPLPGLTPAGFSLQVADRGQFTASGQQAALTGITATGKGPISIVLTWYDYPADLNAPTQLVNDLDLVVRLELPAATATAAAATAATIANGTAAIEGRGTKSTNPTGSSGNSTGGSSSQQQEPLLQPLTHFLGNNHEDEGAWRHGLPSECVPYAIESASLAPDRLNTVERVYITHPSPGAALTITVTAHSLPSRLFSGRDALLPQRWAVAVVGHFSGTLASELTPAYVRQGQLGTRGDSGSPAPPSPTPPPAAADVSSRNNTAAASVNTTSPMTGEGTSDGGTSSNRTAAPKQQQQSPAHKPSPPAAASSGGNCRRRTSASPTASTVWSAGGGGKEGIPWAWGLRGGGHTSDGLQRWWPQLRESMWLLLPAGRVGRSAAASGTGARNAAASVVEDKEDMERSIKGT